MVADFSGSAKTHQIIAPFLQPVDQGGQIRLLHFLSQHDRVKAARCADLPDEGLMPFKIMVIVEFQRSQRGVACGSKTPRGVFDPLLLKPGNRGSGVGSGHGNLAAAATYGRQQILPTMRYQNE